MRAINLANDKKRNAEVGFEALPKKPTVITVLPDGGARQNVKFIKSIAEIDKLVETFGELKKVGEAIIAGDPDVDTEIVGRLIRRTHKLYFTQDNTIVYRVNMVQVIHNPDGSEKERRDESKSLTNVNAEFPVQWSGKQFPKAEALRKFVFTKKYQLRHTSGLTYDFLYEMAKTLHENKSLMFVGSGKKGNEPIVLTTGGEPYRGFLEGRVDGDRYSLILHLTNMELKALPKTEEAAA
ncbi:hypothetical protein FACS1894158_00620 [Betaproteobacteria bacterium]|nr:hypothetical protein FACS1894158_00620 [Betaproteobacteria bacterium]